MKYCPNCGTKIEDSNNQLTVNNMKELSVRLSVLPTGILCDLFGLPTFQAKFPFIHANGNILDTFKESFKWAGYNDGDNVGGKFGIWAPDVVYNSEYLWSDGSKGAYMLYYSTSSTWRRSCIGFMVSKFVDRDFKYVDTIIYSGFTNTGKVNYDGNSRIDTTWSNNYLNLKKLMNKGTIDNNISTWKCFYPDGTWNSWYAPNAIFGKRYAAMRYNLLITVKYRVE